MQCDFGSTRLTFEGLTVLLMSYRRYAINARWGIVTRGEKGCIAVRKYSSSSLQQSRWETCTVPAFALQPDEVVDTTGAGDAFIGGLAASIVRGLDLLPALRIASWVAAENCKGEGARGGMPSATDMPAEVAALWDTTTMKA